MSAHIAKQPSSFEILLIVSGTVALAQGTNGLTVPALPKLIDEIGGDTLIVGLAVSLYSISRMLTNIPAGLIAERIGRRRTLIAGGLLTAVAATLSGVAPNVPVLLALRFLTGMGAAATITAGFIAITDLSSAENRARSLGVLQGWQFIVGVAGPALGGFLTDYAGVHMPFYVSGIGVALLALYAIVRMPETKHLAVTETVRTAEKASSADDGPRSLLRNSNYLLICTVVFTLFFIRFGATQTLVPVFAYDELGWSPAKVGVLFSVASLVNGLLIYPSAYFADKRGRKIAIVPAGWVTVVGLALMAFAHDETVFIAAYMIQVAGSSFSGQAPMAFVGDVVSARTRGAATGVYRSVGDAAGVIGPLTTTSLAHSVSFGAGFMVTAAVAAVSYALFGLFAREMRVDKRVTILDDAPDKDARGG